MGQEGDRHQIYFDSEKDCWKIVHEDQPDTWLAEGPPVAKTFEPPRHNWSIPAEKRGRMRPGVVGRVGPGGDDEQQEMREKPEVRSIQHIADRRRFFLGNRV